MHLKQKDDSATMIKEAWFASLLICVVLLGVCVLCVYVSFVAPCVICFHGSHVIWVHFLCSNVEPRTTKQQIGAIDDSDLRFGQVVLPHFENAH